MAFKSPIDIVNRGLQRVGSPLIATFQDNTKQAAQSGFVYDKVRLAELERSTWRFATYRSTLRALTATTLRMIPPLYNDAATYAVGSVVQDTLGIYWVAMVANTGNGFNGPGTVQTGQPNNWTQYFGPISGDLYSTTVIYSAGELVYTVVDEADVWYISVVNNNQNNAVGTAGVWTPLSATDLPITILGPAGPNVSNNNLERNVFMLPNGFLRLAAPDPRVGSGSTPATSGGLKVLDWQFEQNYFVTKAPGPLVIRAVCDISDVTAFDPLFCEGLGARIGYELAEALTQSQGKQQACAGAYAQFIQEARNKNRLEIGSTEDDDDGYLATIGPAGVKDKMPAAPAPQRGG